MLYAIFCIDRPGTGELRAEHLAAHRRHLDEGGLQVVLSGPLVDEESRMPVGSLVLVEAARRSDVVAFVERDPLQQSGVWDKFSIEAFALRVNRLDRKGAM